MVFASTNQDSHLSVAQVTDIHLFADENKKLLDLPTQKSFQAVLKKLQRLRHQIDLLLLTGDLSHDGTPESYDLLQKLLCPIDKPIYWLPGNHDCISAMQQVLHQKPVSPLKVFSQEGWNFILMNSSVLGCTYGYLSTETLEWLDFQLQIAAINPTVVALHHPPFCVNSNWLDTSTLKNPEEFFAVLDRHPQVKLVLFGHIHQEFHLQRQGVHYLGTPSTSIQFEPQSSRFALDKETPGFRLLNLYPNGRWQTRIERVAYAHQLDLAATGY